MPAVTTAYIIGLFFHILAAVIWVGGMFFAYVVLRPALGFLEPTGRLAVWRGVFAGFFPVIWAVVIVLLLSGYGMVFAVWGGFARAGLHVHIMQATGIVMMLAFAHLFFASWKRFRRALDAGDMAIAATQLTQIRGIIVFNLVLGLVTVVIGATGRVWG